LKDRQPASAILERWSAARRFEFPDIRTTFDSVVATDDHFALRYVDTRRAGLPHHSIEPLDERGGTVEHRLVRRHKNCVVGHKSSKCLSVVRLHRVQEGETGSNRERAWRSSLPDPCARPWCPRRAA